MIIKIITNDNVTTFRLCVFLSFLRKPSLILLASFQAYCSFYRFDFRFFVHSLFVRGKNEIMAEKAYLLGVARFWALN
jgi:hypothetical protein